MDIILVKIEAYENDADDIDSEYQTKINLK